MQSNELFPVLAIAFSSVALAGLAVVWVTLRGYRRNQRIIMGSRGTVDVAEHMAIVDDKLTNLRLAVEDLTLTARDHGVRIDGTLSHVGIVRFDAYRDLGGRQSTAVAFMNSHNNGVVITTVVSRDFARMYVKLVKDGVGDIPLAPEENEAVQQARRATPFVVKPVLEGGETPEVAPPGGGDLSSLGEDRADGGQHAWSLRARRGPARPNERTAGAAAKACLSSSVAGLAASTQGWTDADTPVPPGASMAEQFVQQRRRGKQAPPVSDETAETYVDPEDGDWTAATVARPDGGWSATRADDEWGFDMPVDDDTHEV